MFRYSDFLGLHEKLVARYQGRGRIIPPAPEKSLLGTTRVKIINIIIIAIIIIIIIIDHPSSSGEELAGHNQGQDPKQRYCQESQMSKLQVKMGGGEVVEEGGQGHTKAHFISLRRAALERFINRVALHPVLRYTFAQNLLRKTSPRLDVDFVDFLECSSDLPRATSTSAISSASVFKMITRVGETVNKMAYKMEEGDPWFEEKTMQVE